MPALSPTMEAGTIASWKVEEGTAFAAGDVICEVETDKATVDFEAQDEGVLAKRRLHLERPACSISKAACADCALDRKSTTGSDRQADASWTAWRTPSACLV